MAEPQGDFQYIKMPDGSYGKFAANADDATIRGAIQKDFPDAYNNLSPAHLAHVKEMSAQPTQFEQDRQGANTLGQSGFGMNTLKSLGHALGGIVSAPGAVLDSAMHPEQIPMKSANLVNTLMTNDAGRKASGRSLPYRIASGISDATGIGNAPAMEQAADTGNSAGIAGMATGSALGNIAPVVAAPRLANALKGGPQPIEIPPAEQTSRTLATRLTNSAKDAPGVTSTVGNQLDTLKKFAPEGISRKQGLLDLSKTAGTAAEADPYLSDYIEPNKDAPVGNSGMTVGQAHSRLAQINDTLHPKYMRGGSGSPSAQAAIGAEQASALEGEANSLRQGIADSVGKRMGIDPDYVRGLRKNYEQLKDIGWRADVADYAHQMGLKDPAIPTSKMGIMERGYNRFFNNPNSGVAKAFNGYEASPTPEPPGYPLTGPSDVLKPLAQHPLNPQPLEHANFEPRDVSADSRAYLDEAARRRESRPEPAPLAKVPTTRPDVTDQPIKVSEPMDNSAESKQYLDEAARRRNGKPKSATKEK